jgi:hypothetical protein
MNRGFEGQGGEEEGRERDTLDVPELFERVGGIGDELSEKDLEDRGKEEKRMLSESTACH